MVMISSVIGLEVFGIIGWLNKMNEHHNKTKQCRNCKYWIGEEDMHKTKPCDHAENKEREVRTSPLMGCEYFRVK